jgi:hypothetical protein
LQTQPKGEFLEYVRKVDFAAIEKNGADEHITQTLSDHASGAGTCSIYGSRVFWEKALMCADSLLGETGL